MVFLSAQASHTSLEKLSVGAMVCWLLKWGLCLCDCAATAAEGLKVKFCWGEDQLAGWTIPDL